MGMLIGFLAVAYRPLEILLTHPRRSEAAFADRAAVGRLDRTLTAALGQTEQGYLWFWQEREGNALLLGQGRAFRPASQSPVTHYVLFRHSVQSSELERWEWTVEQVQQRLGRSLEPGAQLAASDLQSLLQLPGARAARDGRVTDFQVEVGEVCRFTVEVSSADAQRPLGSPRRGPRRLATREVAVLRDGRR